MHIVMCNNMFHSLNVISTSEMLLEIIGMESEWYVLNKLITQEPPWQKVTPVYHSLSRAKCTLKQICASIYVCDYIPG